MHADPKGVLTGVHFLDGDHACCEGTLAAGARFAAGYPITPSTEVVERFASRIPTVGGVFIQMEDETGRLHRHPGSRVGRREGVHRHFGSGLFADDGAHRLCGHDRNAMRVCQCAARRTVHGPADAAGAGRHDAGQLGIARRLRHHRALPEFAAGVLRPHHHRLQPGRGVPRPGDDDARRVRRPHDGKSGDSASRPDRGHRRGVTPTSRQRSITPFEPGEDLVPDMVQGGRWLPLPRHRPDPRRTRLPQHERRPRRTAWCAACWTS